MAFIAAGIIGGVGAIAGGVIASNGAKDAANKQADAANQASQMQKQMYDQTRADQEPWRQAGSAALSQLSDPYFQQNFGMSDFQKDPGYDFRMQEGQKALERSAAARGGLQTGGFMKALTNYGQDYASNEYQNAYNRFTNDQSNRFNRLSSVAGLGQTANTQLGAAGQNYANQYGANTMGAAQAAGNAGLASAGAWGSALSGLGRTGMDIYAMNNQPNWMSQSMNTLSSAPTYEGGRTVGLFGRSS